MLAVGLGGSFAAQACLATNPNEPPALHRLGRSEQTSRTHQTHRTRRTARTSDSLDALDLSDTWDVAVGPTSGLSDSSATPRVEGGSFKFAAGKKSAVNEPPPPHSQHHQHPQPHRHRWRQQAKILDNNGQKGVVLLNPPQTRITNALD